MSTVYPLVLLLCLFLVALFAASEAVLAATNRIRLRHMLRVQQGDDQSGASILSSELSGDAQKFIATVTIAANVPLVAASALALWMGYDRLGPRLAFLVSLGIALFTVTVFQVTPRLVVSAPGALERLWWVRPARLLVAILRPLVGLMLAFGRMILAPTGLLETRRRETGTEAQPVFLDLVQSADEGSELGASKELIESIFTFGDTRVHEVMIPRPDIVSLPLTCTAEEAMSLLEETGMSRIPLHETSVDQIAGILHVKDVLACISRGETQFQPRNLLRKPLYLPESLKIDEALASMRSERTHLAIVMDEFGGTAGLITIEDILEELVGEIADEHDRRDEEPLLALSETTALVDARLHTDDLQEQWKVTLPEGEFDTVGGVMIEQLGRAVAVGDKLELPEVTLTVMSLRGRRPRRIRVVKHPRVEEPKPEAREGKESRESKDGREKRDSGEGTGADKTAGKAAKTEAEQLPGEVGA